MFREGRAPPLRKASVIVQMQHRISTQTFRPAEIECDSAVLEKVGARRGIVRKISLMVLWENNPHRHGSE